ncbi:MAG: phosphopantothenate/pantothenate synthetase [Thaumarchaeota archaeon]|nr:phosphopantothenate/pantothenate synthetase [Nitrososphaerota archaeon]
MLTSVPIPKNHPRAQSLFVREKLVEAFRKGVVVPEGLIAHGRGEAFDYILGEKTTDFARKAVRTAAAALILAKKPVISVNGNVAALASDKVIELSKVAGAAIEINLFYRTTKREVAIAKVLRNAGAGQILGVGENASSRIAEMLSERRRVDPEGILTADVVLVPLEDGDRTEALRKLGKTVIAIDLNPLSRTSLNASISIVDNVTRTLPLLTDGVKSLKGKKNIRKIAEDFNNQANLREAFAYLAKRLDKLSRGANDV